MGMRWVMFGPYLGSTQLYGYDIGDVWCLHVAHTVLVFVFFCFSCLL